MLHMTDRQSLNFQFGAFTVLVFTLIHSCRGQSQLIGPSQPIVALVGDDIILPCHLEPAMNVFDMTVEWARPDLDPRFVIVWRAGVELESKKHPSYRGRTSVFTDELKRGNVSLKLSNVRRSDEGTYRSFIPGINRALTVQLVVGAVSSPVIQMTKTISEVVLQCESEGWYPEPELLWLDAEGNLLSAGPAETLRGPDGLCTVSSNVTVDKTHGNNFTCRVQQKKINQTRETHVQVPDHFFMVPSSPSTPSSTSAPGSQQVIIGAVIGCAALVFIAAVVFVVWKWRQKKSKNKRRSHEDGPEQTEGEKTVTSGSDNTGFQVVMEGEGESVPLMAGREEQNSVDNRGEEKSEHEDPQVGAERETHGNELVTKPDVDRTGGEREVKSIKNEEESSIPTEGENHEEQDMTGRQVLGDQGEGGGEQMMKPVKEDSGLPVAEEAEGPKEQTQNVHTDQDIQKEEETQQEPITNVDKKEKRNKKKKAKEKNKKEQETEGGSGSRGQKKNQENQKEPSQAEAERMTAEDETKLRSETQKRKETEKDKIELKPQKGNDSQHLLQDRKQETSEAEHEDKKEKDQEGNQSNIKRTTERKAQNQDEKLKKEKTENERKLQSERTELKTQEGGDSQQVLDANKPEQTAEHENKRGKDQRDVTSMTESKMDKQEEQSNKKLEETEEKKDWREKQPPSVSREITETPDLKVHEDTAEGQNQEKKLQAEKQEEETSPRNQEESKEQPEHTKKVKVECKERRKQGSGSDKEADVNETQKKVKEIRQEGQQQAVQQPLVIEKDVTEQIQELFKNLSERGAECQDVEMTDVDRRPIKKAKRGVKHQPKQVKEFHVDHQQMVREKRPWEEDSEQTQESSKKVKDCPEEQHDVVMGSVEEDSEQTQESSKKVNDCLQEPHDVVMGSEEEEEEDEDL